MNPLSIFHAKKYTLSIAFAAGLLATPLLSHATTVQFQTVMGDFEVNLFDKTTPETVENFLAYVNAGKYEDIVMHRLVPGFVLQGGGFVYDEIWPPKSVVQNTPVVNEPVYSNRRGTIAMAKGVSVNSATSQWFFNLKDNSANLDRQNGGFTVFGQVTGNGMAIIDAMAALNHFKKGGVFDELPLRDYSLADHSNGVAVTDENVVMILDVAVLNASPDTADNLTPVKNTLINADEDEGGSGGGGGLGLLSILALGVLTFGRALARRGKN